MRKRISSKSAQIPPVTLYRDELVELIGIFTQYCKRVEIRDSGTVYDSFEEATQLLKGPVKELQIVGTDPNVTLYLQNGSLLTQKFDKDQMAQEDIDRIDLLFIRVKDFLEQHKQNLFFRPGGFLVALVTIAILLLAIMMVYIRPPSWGKAIGTLVCWAFLIAWLGTLKSSRSGIGTVSFQPKVETRGFLKENKDKIILLIMGGIFTQALRIAWEYFSKK